MASAALSPPSLKVFIMAGQSNMVGHGFAEGSQLHWNATSQKQQRDPSLPLNLNGSLLTPEFAFLKDTAGAWKKRADVWVIYNESGNDIAPHSDLGSYWHGNLSVGYGGVHKNVTVHNVRNATEVGPELGFGWALGDAYNGSSQVLLIKTAWGGKSLDVDFRPPSSAKVNGSKPVGPYYLWMVREVKDALTKLEDFFPTYSTSQGYEIAGFAWHQGWNDACKAGGADPSQNNYELNLANLIRDLRKDLNAPKMKAVVGALGICGFPNTTKYPHGVPYEHCTPVCTTLANEVIPAQLAVGDAGKYPEFEGNVASVDTREYHYDQLDSPGGQCYHWNNNAQSYWHVGQAMARAWLAL
jgi:alpha-galactosidase